MDTLKFAGGRTRGRGSLKRPEELRVQAALTTSGFASGLLRSSEQPTFSTGCWRVTRASALASFHKGPLMQFLPVQLHAIRAVASPWLHSAKRSTQAPPSRDFRG